MPGSELWDVQAVRGLGRYTLLKHVDDVGRRSVSASGNVQSVKGISSPLKPARWVAAKLVAVASQQSYS